jgi:hypothetical protein
MRRRTHVSPIARQSWRDHRSAGNAGMRIDLAPIDMLDLALEPLIGTTLLLVGPAGEIGSFATQLAANAGAQLIAVAQAGAGDRLRTYGGTEVVDYTPVPETVARTHPEWGRHPRRRRQRCRRVRRTRVCGSLRGDRADDAIRRRQRRARPTRSRRRERPAGDVDDIAGASWRTPSSPGGSSCRRSPGRTRRRAEAEPQGEL